MRYLRSILAALVLAFGLVTAAAAETAWVPYTPEAFGAAQARDALVLVDVHADWCPVCRAQAPILDELRAAPELEKVVFIKVSFDDHKDFLKAHRVARQSTIIMFKGEQEAGRSVAETDRTRLREFVLTAAR